MKAIKIGQIGIGHNHAVEQMATVRRLPAQFEVVGVVEPSAEWKQKRGGASAYKGIPWLTEEQLFNTPGLDAVLVETDVPQLVPTAKRCLEAGYHVHMDKPAGYSLEEFGSMLKIAEAHELTVQLGYMFRNNPAVNLCQRAVSEGWLGNVFEISTVMSRTMDDDYCRWLAQFHGGSMYIFGSHLIDLIVSLLGRPEKVTPFLRESTRFPKLIDNGFAVLEYPHAVATVRAALIEVEGFRRRQLVVCGDEGTFEVKPIEGCDVQAQQPPLPKLSPTLTLSRPCGEFKAGANQVPMPEMSGRYVDQLKEFAAIIRGQIKNPYSYDHEYLVQEVLLAACGKEPVIL
jgi:predicted dehydrogenase